MRNRANLNVSLRSKRVPIARNAMLAAAFGSAFGVWAACPAPADGSRQLLWGDLHVHTSYSLDANVYGTLATPADAYRFARGEPLTRADGSVVQLERALDFVAVTEHAEWLDFTFLCDSDQGADFPDCRNLLENRAPGEGADLFRQYVVPSITGPVPTPLKPCAENPALCQQSALNRWQAVQQQTEQFNEPCSFTTLHGYEWSHTPNFRHAHRNVLFRSASVTEQAIDYIHFPTVEALWNALDEHCDVASGCEALTIPHNTNMGDGISFELSNASEQSLRQRAHYERLIEITQEKGTSECLAPFGEQSSTDCSFELYLTRQSRPTEAEAYSQPEWEQMRSTYARSLVGQGLALPGEEGPLRMGFIGSTDTHAATPGYVDEHLWSGSTLAGTGLDGAMLRRHWSPGGLVAVWAEENTRSSIFDALRRREVYATSGPRIALRFAAQTAGSDFCSHRQTDSTVLMGAQTQFSSAPEFTIQVQTDSAPLDSVQIIKLSWLDGEVQEQVIDVWDEQDDRRDRCITWQDPEFNAAAPTLWYPRVLQQTTPRWTAVQCAAANRCDEFADVNFGIQERAWGSPIWHIPR